MKNMLVAQSGGPSAAINATITGVIDAGLESEEIRHVYGALNGIKGVLNENFVMLDEICRQQNFTSLRYHRLDDLIESIGIDSCKLCTYCFNGEE